MSSSPDVANLRLYEEALLLALRDDKGTAHLTVDSWHALATAVLAELVLEGRVRIDDEGGEGKDRVLVATDRGAVEDPLLETWRTRIASAPEPERPSAWTANLAADKDLRRDAARGLVERGVLHAEHDRLLKLIPRTRYPEDDTGPEQAVVERLRAAIFTDTSDVAERTCALLALARPTGLLPVHFERKALKQATPRIERLLAASPIARTVEALLPTPA